MNALKVKSSGGILQISFKIELYYAGKKEK